MYGNLNEQNAKDYLSIVETKLKSTKLVHCEKLQPLQKAHTKNFRQVKLPEGCNLVYLKPNSVHKTNAIEVYYQCGEQNTKDNAMVELFCQVIGESSFNVLRTQEQLGYIVASGVRSFDGVQGIRVIVQSDKSPAYLDQRIEEFKVHVDALALNKLEEPKKMSKQCDIYWSEVVNHQYNFEREAAEVEELKKLTKNDLAEFFASLVDNESKQRKKVAIYIHPPELGCELTNEKLEGTLIDDLSDWQTGLQLSPLKKPFTELK